MADEDVEELMAEAGDGELKNRDPQLVVNAVSIIGHLLATYGWYVFAVIIGLVFVYHKYWHRFRERVDRMNEDPDELSRRRDQMDAARRRQQEIYNKQREEYDEKEAEKKREKQRQRDEMLRSLPDDKDVANELRKRQSKALRDNSYNPLLGSSSGSTYRPSRQCGPSGGGG